MSINSFSSYITPPAFANNESLAQESATMAIDAPPETRKRPLEPSIEPKDLLAPPAKRTQASKQPPPNFFQQEINPVTARDILASISPTKKQDFLLSCHPDHLTHFIPLCDSELLYDAINLMSPLQRQSAFTSLPLEEQFSIIPDIHPTQLKDLCTTYTTLQRGSDWKIQFNHFLDAMSEEQLSETLPHLSSQQIKASVCTFTSREAVKLILEKLPPSYHPYALGSMSPQQRDFACLVLAPDTIKSFTRSLNFQAREKIIGHLRNYTDKDFINEPLAPFDLAAALSDETLYEKIISVAPDFSPELLKLTVAFVPADDFHDFVDCLSIHQIIPLLPYTSPEQIKNGLGSIGEHDTQLLIRHMSVDQIRAGISELDGKLLKDCLNLMSLRQLKAAIECMPDYHKEFFTTPFKNLPYDNSDIVREFISVATPAEIAIIMMDNEIREQLKSFLHMMSYEQLRIGTGVLIPRKLIDFLENLSTRQRREVISSIPQESAEIFNKCLQLQSPDYLLTWAILKEENTQLQKLFSWSKKEIRNFNPENNTLSKGQELSRSLHKLISKCSGLKKKVQDLLPKMEVLLAFAQAGWGIHPLKLRKNSVSNIQVCVKQIRNIMQDLNASQADSLAHILQSKLQRCQNDGSHSPMFSEIEAVYADRNQTWNLYNQVKDALINAGITLEKLDSVDVSWEEIIASGVKNTEDLERLNIKSAEDLQRHIQSFGNSESD
ncbi:MAG: Mg/Co/Ni transporter MgtE [Chlamydiales bacterium]|jgi:Mg/Co/Ni transporter MgtE